MDSPCDSDASEGMQDLGRRGFAIRRERELDLIGDAHVQFHYMDVSHVQRPLALNLPAGIAPTHGLTAATQESVTARGRNRISSFPGENILSWGREYSSSSSSCIFNVNIITPTSRGDSCFISVYHMSQMPGRKYVSSGQP